MPQVKPQQAPTINIPDKLKASMEEEPDTSDFDDLLDRLPGNVRNQVLHATGIHDNPNKPQPWSKGKRLCWWLGLMCAFMWAIPWLMLALVAAITVVGFPIACIAWAIGAGPMSKMIETKVHAPAEMPWKRV